MQMVLIKKHEKLFIALPDRSQKMGSSFSKELGILCCVPQGSILGPLLSNIDIFCLFFIDMSSDIANYADDTSPYKCALHYDKLKESDNLQNIWWFMYNNFKANTTK